MPSIHYREQGQGFPLILIHGFCESLEIWNLVINTLAGKCRTIAIDLPGFGKSQPLTQQVSMDAVAQEIIRFLREDLHITSCIVMGHSLGGYVTLAMAAQDPELVKAFGLIHSTAYADSEERKNARLKVVEFVQQHGVKPFIASFIPPLFADPGHPQIPAVVTLAAQTPQQTLIDFTLAMRNRPDRSLLLAAWDKPILFLAGNKDSIIPVDAVRQQSSLVRNASVYFIEGVAHMSMMEAPAVCAHHMLDFTFRTLTGD